MSIDYCGYRVRGMLPWRWVASVLCLCVTSCSAQSVSPMVPTSLDGGSTQGGSTPAVISEGNPTAALATLSNDALLQESWRAYKKRFIQSDGRVIDWESNARTVSEGQAYALLRAVLADDPATFDLVLQWAENNLKSENGRQANHLWAWTWGQRPNGSWGVTDENFASDADVDAATALILAARRWNRPDYQALAQKKLADIWDFSTLVLPAAAPQASPRYLLPGPLQSFQPSPGKVYLNPSYLAPYAFRLFAQVDPGRDWLTLVESSYAVLGQTKALSSAGLPADWVVLEMASQQLQPAPSGGSLQSRYGFDAYRVWWRVALDAAWFQEPRADQFLADHLGYLKALWQRQTALPAVLDLNGKALADYEATAQYAMLYPALLRVDPALANTLRQERLLTTYRDGIWDNDNAYYAQNLAWLGLFPADQVPATLLKPSNP